MTTRQQPKRFRLRFTLRTLAIFLTLVCCYAACWGPTKRWGVDDVVAHDVRFRSSLADGVPIMVLWTFTGDRLNRVSPRLPLIVRVTQPGRVHRYYFWFFGYVAKLPYEREVEPTFTPDEFRRLIETWERIWESNGESSEPVHGGVI